MQVDGIITGWQEDGAVDGYGYVHDVKRTVTFHFRNGYSGTTVTLPWNGPWPPMEGDPRSRLYRLTIEAVESADEGQEVNANI